MKSIYCYVLFSCLIFSGTAQEAKLQPLIEQIIAVRIYWEYAQKGVRIATQGLQTIRDIKNGDLQIHTTFLNRLKAVNPVLLKMSKLESFANTYSSIERRCHQTIRSTFQNDQLANAEKNQLQVVVANFRKENRGLNDQLLAVITPNQLTMTDDERIEHIESLYNEIRTLYHTVGTYTTQVALLIAHRLREKNDIDRSKKLR